MGKKNNIYSIVNDYLDEVTETLAFFLEKALPSVSDNWEDSVVLKLTTNQQIRLKQRFQQQGIARVSTVNNVTICSTARFS